MSDAKRVTESYAELAMRLRAAEAQRDWWEGYCLRKIDMERKDAARKVLFLHRVYLGIMVLVFGIWAGRNWWPR